MHVSAVRVLVVDDFERWRLIARATLGQIPGVVIVGDASDGIEAVRKAQELEPDLLVLDIGLPNLNGIEVAREIRKVLPVCKIVFLTENNCGDLAEEALNAGANAYVLKSCAAEELIPAVAAVLENQQFLSANLTALAL